MADNDGSGTDSDSAAASENSAAEPGFGDAATGAELPDMRDELPTFEDSVAEQSGAGAPGNPGNESEQDSEATAGVANTAGGTPGSDSGATDGAGERVGTRAPDGLESDLPGVNGELTPAEQVAILDRQLEQSTSDFDTLILEEQARQRAAERERANSRAQANTEEPIPAGDGRSPYQDDIARQTQGGRTGGGMGGAAAGSQRAQTKAIYEAPGDIPEGSDDDVVARQLREAAMREPDPEVREKLWNEYRKYKGIEIPSE